MVNQKVCKKKYLSCVYGVDRKIRHSGSLFDITRQASSEASLVMPISDHYDRFFYPHLTHMKDLIIANLTANYPHRPVAFLAVKVRKFHSNKFGSYSFQLVRTIETEFDLFLAVLENSPLSMG